jgi:hypothetical protein
MISFSKNSLKYSTQPPDSIIVPVSNNKRSSSTHPLSLYRHSFVTKKHVKKAIKIKFICLQKVICSVS